MSRKFGATGVFYRVCLCLIISSEELTQARIDAMPTASRPARYRRSPSALCELATSELAWSSSACGAARRVAVIFREPHVAPTPRAVPEIQRDSFFRTGFHLRAIHDCLVQGLREADLPEASITLVPTRDRSASRLLLTGIERRRRRDRAARRQKSLVARVEAEARSPVFAHLEGVTTSMSIMPPISKWAKSIVLNAKMRRPGRLRAPRTLLVDRKGGVDQLSSRWSRC